MKLTIEAVNALDLAGFVQAFGRIFEDSAWVAERAWASRPFANIDRLHAAMVAAVDKAEMGERLALLLAHPDLGTRARISDASTTEQAGAGLDRLTPEEFERLHRMNAAYRDKFGFPFLFAVKGSNKAGILYALEARLNSGPDAELHEAMRQVYRIAEFRLEEMFD